MPLSQIEQSIIDIINGADFVSEAPTNGSDIIIGTDLADGVYLLDGDDIASGGLGNDKLYGGNGDDGILGGGGNDILFGKNGNDSLFGGDGKDRISGGDDNDFIGGGEGDDRLWGDDDELDGGDGKDNLFGDSGDDVINGDDGNDKLTGGTGNDTMTGGAGADNFYFVSGDGQDVITDFEIGIDTITIDGLALDVWLDGANWSVVSASETTFSVTSLSGDALTLENVDGLALFNNFLF